MAVTRGSVSTEVLRVQTAVRIEDVPRIARNGLQPQRFVRDAAVWPLVEAAVSNPAGIVDLVQRRHELPTVPSLEKLWAEAIYECVRQRLQPLAPSRLGCLYAVEMGYDAITILPELGLDAVTFDRTGLCIKGPAVLAGRTCGRWFAADMHLFSLPPTLVPRPAQIAQELTDIELLAERYWSGDASDDPLTELLCEALERPGI